MSLIQQFLLKNQEKTLKIDCIGDAMIDQYFDVSVNRISPEFPMPIMSSLVGKPVAVKPGGAANVAHQFLYFNVDRRLCCFSDPALIKVCENYNIPLNGVSLSEGCVPVKNRYQDHGIQVVRWDVEDLEYGLEKQDLWTHHDRLMDGYIQLDTPDVAILSDYNKGVFSQDISWIKYLGLEDTLTVVDPKDHPLSRWKGCTIIKPNATEALKMTGFKSWERQCLAFEEATHCRGVFITQGDSGVRGIWDQQTFSFQAPRQVDAKSVIGAGDAFIAGLAMALGHGFTGSEAAEIAYEMGSIYVQNRHNRPITPAEIGGGILYFPEDLNKRDYKLALVYGSFEILQEKHLNLFDYAKTKADKLVVAVWSGCTYDSCCPRLTVDERMSVLTRLKMVDFVVTYNEDDPKDIIRRISPDVLVNRSYNDAATFGISIPEIYTYDKA